MWTEEMKQRERDRINQTKPWLYLKGTKTPEGLKRSAMNSYKHGMRSAQMRELESQLAQLKRQEREAKNLIDEFDVELP